MLSRLFVKRRRAAVALVQRLLVGLAGLVLRLFVAPLRLANALGPASGEGVNIPFHFLFESAFGKAARTL